MCKRANVNSYRPSANTTSVIRDNLHVAQFGIIVRAKNPARWIEQVFPNGQTEKRRLQVLPRLLSPPCHIIAVVWGGNKYRLLSELSYVISTLKESHNQHNSAQISSGGHVTSRTQASVATLDVGRARYRKD